MARHCLQPAVCQNSENGITVRVENENVWLRAEAIAELFQKSRSIISIRKVIKFNTPSDLFYNFSG